MISVCFQGRPFTMIVIWVYAPTTNAEEAEVDWFYKHLQDLLELTSKIKRCPFHHRGLECKSSKSRATWSNRQIWLGVQNEAGRVCFLREHTGHSKHPLPTTQAKTLHMDITRWSILKSAKDEEVLYSQQKQDWKLTVAQNMNSLLLNSNFNWTKQGKPLDHSAIT